MPSYLFSSRGIRASVTNFLTESGFIWILWIGVGIFTIMAVFSTLKAVREGSYHDSFKAFLFFLIAGVISWVTIGNALIMLAPIVIGVGIFLASSRMAGAGRKADAEIHKGQFLIPEIRQETIDAAQKARLKEAETSEEEAVEKDEEQEERIEEFILTDEFAEKKPLIDQIKSRIILVRKYGLAKRDTVYTNYGLGPVLLEYLTKLRTFTEQEITRLKEELSLESHTERIKKLQKHQQQMEIKLGYAEVNVEKGVFDEIDIEKEKLGTETRPLAETVERMEGIVKKLETKEVKVSKEIIEESRKLMTDTSRLSKSIKEIEEATVTQLKELNELSEEIKANNLPPETLRNIYKAFCTALKQSAKAFRDLFEVQHSEIKDNIAVLNQFKRRITIKREIYGALTKRNTTLERLLQLMGENIAVRQANQTIAAAKRFKIEELNKSWEKIQIKTKEIQEELVEMQKARTAEMTLAREATRGV